LNSTPDLRNSPALIPWVVSSFITQQESQLCWLSANELARAARDERKQNCLSVLDGPVIRPQITQIFKSEFGLSQILSQMVERKFWQIT
jgi:hypothetical protein